jgi:hypothetical protein
MRFRNAAWHREISPGMACIFTQDDRGMWPEFGDSAGKAKASRDSPQSEKSCDILLT